MYANIILKLYTSWCNHLIQPKHGVFLFLHSVNTLCIFLWCSSCALDSHWANWWLLLFCPIILEAQQVWANVSQLASLFFPDLQIMLANINLSGSVMIQVKCWQDISDGWACWWRKLRFMFLKVAKLLMRVVCWWAELKLQKSSS